MSTVVSGFIHGMLLALLCIMFTRMANADTKCCPKYKVVTKTVEKIVYIDKPVFVEKPVLVDKVVEKVVTIKQTVGKNNLSLLVGKGPTDIQTSGSRVDLYSDVIGGLSYTRSIGVLSVGGQIQSNRSILGSVGINF